VRPFRRLIVAALLTVAAALAVRGPHGLAAQEAPRPVPEIARNVRPGHRLVFVGLDGTDWGLLDRYIARGVMPNLGRLVAEGFSGRLRTMDPPLSPLLWTTMMTGASPLAHRILDFAQFDPSTGQKAPIFSSERRVPAIWNMASMAGKRSAVFGLWATYPAESIDGLIVSDRLFSFLFKGPTPLSGIVYPRQREAWARDTVTRVSREVDLSALRAYLPWLTAADYRSTAESSDPYSQPISALRRILIEERVYRELALEWIQSQRPDLAIVYVEATDTIGHVFAPYAPPRQPSVSERDYERYQSVPERFFASIDRALGQFAEAAKASGAILMLASDHGFFWSDGRPAGRPGGGTTANAAAWHAPDGLYLLWGPGITPNTGHGGRGNVQQVAATLLALLGLPPARDIEAPLEGVEAANQAGADYALHYRPSRPPMRTDDTSIVDDDAMRNLRSLGYVGGSTGARGEGSRTPESYNNEGGFLQGRGKSREAIAAFERALTLDPNLLSAQRNLSEALFAAGQNLDRADRLLLSAFAGGLPGARQYVVDRALAYTRGGQPQRGLKLLEAVVRAKPGDAEAWRLRGVVLMNAKECTRASASFERAVTLAPRSALAHAAQGEARLCLGDRAGARAALEESLRIDPNQSKVRQLLQTLTER
jgi:tetratricopeptide (TPR) repeat protein